MVMFQLCNPISIEEFNKLDFSLYFIQSKFDGVRAFLTRDANGKITLMNRNLKDITHRYPELQKLKLGYQKVSMDGEIVVLKNGVSDFEALQSREHKEKKFEIEMASKVNPVTFIAFDILYYVEDLKKFKLQARKDILWAFRIYENDNFKIAEYVDANQEFIDKAKERGEEGIILKLKTATYKGERTTDTLKLKFTKEQDIVINSYEINPAGITVTDGKHRIAVNGFKHKPVKEAIDKNGQAMITIEFLQKTSGGMFRMPVFKKLVM